MSSENRPVNEQEWVDGPGLWTRPENQRLSDHFNPKQQRLEKSSEDEVNKSRCPAGEESVAFTEDQLDKVALRRYCSSNLTIISISKVMKCVAAVPSAEPKEIKKMLEDCCWDVDQAINDLKEEELGRRDIRRRLQERLASSRVVSGSGLEKTPVSNEGEGGDGSGLWTRPENRRLSDHFNPKQQRLEKSTVDQFDDLSDKVALRRYCSSNLTIISPRSRSAPQQCQVQSSRKSKRCWRIVVGMWIKLSMT